MWNFIEKVILSMKNEYFISEIISNSEKPMLKFLLSVDIDDIIEESSKFREMNDKNKNMMETFDKEEKIQEKKRREKLEK